MSEPHYHYLECIPQDRVLICKVTPPELRSAQRKLIDLLRQELLAAVALNGTRKVVVDLAAVQFLDSAGFRLLLSLRKKMQEKGGEMLLCGLCENIREVLLAARLINAAGTTAAPFGVAADVAVAVARLEPPPGRK